MLRHLLLDTVGITLPLGATSGNLLVGKTATAFGTAGIEARAGGTLWATASETNAASFNRLSTDGAIAYFSKDGTTVGSIDSRAGVVSTIILNPASGNGAGLSGGTKCIVPADEAGIIDNDVSLGVSSYRFKDLYLSGGVYLGGTVAANLLDDYEEGTWTVTSPTVTFTDTSGYYIKIGKKVFVEAQFTIPSTASGVQFYIDTLPFVAEPVGFGGLSIRYTNNSTVITFHVNGGGTRIGGYNLDGNATSLASVSTHRFDIFGQYTVE
jgi:hypothetical protein